MGLDTEKLNKNLSDYLRGPSSKAVYDRYKTSKCVRLVITVLCTGMGLVKVVSIVHAKDGLKLISETFKAVFSKDPDMRKDPSKLKPLVGHGIIIGKQGFGLVLGSFNEQTQSDLGFMGRKAQRFAKMYTHGSDDPRDEPMVKLLRDDKFSAGGRRRVPELYADGRELILFETLIDIKLVTQLGGGSVVGAFVGELGDSGGIVQIPWTIFSSALT